MHALSSSFVLGYHGCDRDVAENLLAGDEFLASQNEYDWLGPGIYFWEVNPKRGLDWANELKAAKRGGVKSPACVGAVIELGLCLDLTTLAGIDLVRKAHSSLAEIHESAQAEMPVNSKDLLRRNLDCAVIRTVHGVRKDAGDPPLDSVRGIFVEGKPLYENAGFYEKTHIQICVCNPERIKAVFRVPQRFLD